MPTKLPKPSEEQIKIIEDVLKGYNIRITAIAGAGKTTTFLQISENLHKKDKNIKIVILTYSAHLKAEGRAKIKKNNSSNYIEQHSFHSFCYKYYDNHTMTNDCIQNIINRNIEPKSKFKFDVIMIDEFQDCTQLYFHLIKKIIKHNQLLDKNPQILVCGDPRQCVFAFIGADTRYLEFANQLFTTEESWKTHTLSTSYRVTIPIANFINECLFHGKRIFHAVKDGIKPRYCIGDVYKDAFKEIEYYIDELGIHYSELYIIAASIKNGKNGKKTPMQCIENNIKKKYPYVQIFLSDSDNNIKNEEILLNKLCLSSMVASKGLEKYAVILLGFDMSYFLFNAKDENPFEIPNVHYVATSRSSYHLSVFHDYRFDYLPYLKKDKIEECCDIIKYKQLDIKKNTNTIDKYTKKTSLFITDILKFINPSVMKECKKYMKFKQIHKHENSNLQIPTQIKNRKLNTCEYVAHITGETIPIFYLYMKKKKTKLFNEINFLKGEKFIYGDLKIHEKRFIQLEEKYKTNENSLIIKDFLFLVTFKNLLKNKFKYCIMQLNYYNWLADKDLTIMMENMNTLNLDINSLQEEVAVYSGEKIEHHEFHLKGRIDYMTNEEVIELKCTTKLTDEHKLQLIIQAYLHKVLLSNEKDDNYKYILFNIFTKEKLLLDMQFSQIKKIVHILLESKTMSNKIICSDQKFIDNNKIK